MFQMFGFEKKKVRIGTWTQNTHILRADEYICSVCHQSFKKPTKTCPHCKSQMKGSMYDPNWVDEVEFLEEF